MGIEWPLRRFTRGIGVKCFLSRDCTSRTLMNKKKSCSRCSSGLWENRTKVDAGKDFDGFLFIVTRNLIFNRARHSFTAESLADFIDGAGPEFYHDIEGGIDAGFLREAVDRLVTELPPRQREAFVLSRRDGMSIREIAGVMGITEKGVQRNINLALKFLKTNLPLFLIFINL